jgi:hypothetical protein
MILERIAVLESSGGIGVSDGVVVTAATVSDASDSPVLFAQDSYFG